MAAINNYRPLKNLPNTTQSSAVDPVVTAVDQFVPAAKTVDTQFVLKRSSAVDPVVTAVDQFVPSAKTVDTQFVLKSAEADESFRESDMKKEPCDATKALGKRKRCDLNAAEEEYSSAEKELEEHDHDKYEEEYEAWRDARAKFHILRPFRIDIDNPSTLRSPNPELILRKFDKEEDDDDLNKGKKPSYKDQIEELEKREREVLPREMWVKSLIYPKRAPRTFTPYPKSKPPLKFNWWKSKCDG